MEDFKMIIKQRILLFTGLTLFTAVLGVYGFFAAGNSENAGISDGVVSGFQFGLIFGLGIVAFTQLIKLYLVVKDDKKLNMQYNKENDERMKAIRYKAGMPMLLITSVMMLIVAIIAGYFNIVVFYSLAVAAMVQLSIGAFAKLYYMKTM